MSAAYFAYRDEEAGNLPEDADRTATAGPASEAIGRLYDGSLADAAEFRLEHQCEIEHTETYDCREHGYRKTRLVPFRAPTLAALYDAVGDFERKVALGEPGCRHAFRHGDVRKVLVVDDGRFCEDDMRASPSWIRHDEVEAEKRRIAEEKTAEAARNAAAAKEARMKELYEELHARFGAAAEGEAR